MERLTGVEIAWAAQLACLFEASVDKPGNVSPRIHFADARFEDFATSAVAIGPALRDAGRATVGETIARAAADTRRLVATNTNLGMILLLAPLARAAACLEAGAGLRAAVSGVLGGLTVQDARFAYEAIRGASPAGMGEVDRHDVSGDEVTVTLREAMDAARERDSIAREYVTDFEITFTLGAGALSRCWEGRRRLLGRRPDGLPHDPRSRARHADRAQERHDRGGGRVAPRGPRPGRRGESCPLGDVRGSASCRVSSATRHTRSIRERPPTSSPPRSSSS